MQGVGQPCLGEHVEGYFEVSELVCSRGELAPADDSMEADTDAVYESEAPCKEEGAANLAGDEVFEQDKALAGQALKYEELFLEPVTEGWDTSLQSDQVCLSMQQTAGGKWQGFSILCDAIDSYVIGGCFTGVFVSVARFFCRRIDYGRFSSR
ncbi:hypothetical protein GOP47_0025186 [Adiantum capillus-veneris]|uniref:Uncharacterized protein n=1 Tax=Adiantum capillus-veneris TaxID=13818 RepID=A0A9D4U5S3_ADICA|nr:hypothetical protein GOP47_0025186 [Adiantum capillus-veneris]